MQDRFWKRLGKTYSILVFLIHFIKLSNRSNIKKAAKILTTEKDLTILLEKILGDIEEFDSTKHFEQMKVSKQILLILKQLITL